MTNIEDKEIRKGVALVLMIEYLKIKVGESSDQKVKSRKISAIEVLSKKLDSIIDQDSINNELARIVKERKAT